MYEALNNSDKSLESYKKSYYIDKNQENLLFKICEKLETLDTTDSQTVKTWLDRLERKYPNHKSVFVLKDKLELENGNSSSRLEDTFRDLSNVKLSDLTDDKGANLSCSFLNARSPSLAPNQFKSLERSQDRLFKKVCEFEEKFTKAANEIMDIVKENQEMYGKLKGEVDKLNTTMGKLQIGQSEIKQSIDDFISGNYENNEDEEDEEDEDEEDGNDENDPISSFLSCASNPAQNTSGVHARLGVSPKQQASKSISFSQQTPQHQQKQQPPMEPAFFSPENYERQKQIHEALHGLKINQQPQPMGFVLPPSTGFPASVLPAKDSWECKVCYLRNSPTDTKCKSCETANESAAAIIKSPLDQISAAISKLNPTNPIGQLSTVVSGGPSNLANQNPDLPLSELFKNQNANKWGCKTCYVQNPIGTAKCSACEEPNPAVTPVKEQTPAINKPVFSLETGSKGFSFSNLGQPSASAPANSQFVFGQPLLPATNTNKEAPKFNFNNTSQIFGQQQQLTPQAPLFASSASPAKKPQLAPTQTSSFAPPISQFPPLTSAGFVFGSSNASSSLPLQPPVFGGLNLPAASSSSGGLFSPTPTFTPTTVKEAVSHKANESSSEHVEEEEPQFDFTPVIPLPPKVDVVTGEENEKVLFVHRGKLFRFVDNEWKERGLGDIKILHHEMDNRYRLLMRRDQIHKVCLNAPIMPQFEFQAGRTNQTGTMISWGCVDFSEERSNPQIFALRFKTKETVERFREEVLKIVAILNGKEPVKAAPSPAKEPTKFDDLEVVYIKEPKSKEDKEKAEKLKLPMNFFNLDDVKQCAGCNGCKEYIPKLRYEVSDQKENEPDNKPAENADGGNLFASAIADAGSSKSSWTKSAEQPAWMKSALTPIFGGQTSNRPSDDPEAEIETLDFKPVIPLPDLIEVKTGEEDEEVLFSSRAKLYKFTNNEWKERGIGDFKVLRHKTSQKIRFLMRREQVHKICLNHMVDKNLKMGLRHGRDTIYQWGATDFSGESPNGEPSNFNIKFKTKELGRQLMGTLEKVIDGFKES